MSAAGLFSENQSRINSRLYLGSGISNPYPAITGTISATPTATPVIPSAGHSTGVYSVSCTLNIDTAGAPVAADFFYSFRVGGVTVLNQIIAAEAQVAGRELRVDNIVYIDSGIATLPCDVLYDSAGGALVLGTAGSIIFNVTRLC